MRDVQKLHNRVLFICGCSLFRVLLEKRKCDRLEIDRKTVLYSWAATVTGEEREPATGGPRTPF